jgi:hypothetical protein
MGEYTQYAPLTNDDRHYLQLIAGRRWKEVKKRFLITAILPMAIILPMLFIMNLVILANIEDAETNKRIVVPEGVEHFSLLWLAVPVFMLLVAINFIMYLRSIPPVYVDLKRGVKRQLLFMPKPYTLPHTNAYYVNTGLPAMRFIEVSYEQYMSLDYTTPCYLEQAPLTAIPLGIKTVDDAAMLTEG